MPLCDFCNSLTPPNSGVFRHQGTYSALISSGKVCEVCRKLANSFASTSHYRVFITRKSANDDRIRVVANRHFTQGGAVFWYLQVFWDDQYQTGDAIELRPRNSPFVVDRPIWVCQKAVFLEDSIHILRHWLDECCAVHSRCKDSESGERILPTRVIDVGPQNGSQTPFLFVTNGEKGSYTALSHCWGLQMSLRTTKKSFSIRTHSISMESLPKNFQDAVTITRQLHIQYLWIDSLCIVQDDKADWEFESTRMASIFENSTVTIAATAADGSERGCLQGREPASLIEFSPSDGLPDTRCVKPKWKAIDASELWTKAYMRSHASSQKSIEEAPLNQRGWVLQEVRLTPRILHFASDQIFWQCRTRIASEDGVLDTVFTEKAPSGWSDGPQLMSFLRNPPMGMHPTITKSMKYNLWWEIVMNYTSRHLSNRDDMLPALAGLTTVFEGALNDKPIAGLWEDELHDGLLWDVVRGGSEPDSVVQTGIPSWSWASVEKPIKFSRFTPQTRTSCLGRRTIQTGIGEMIDDELKIVRAELSWKGQPLTSPIANAKIEVRGYLDSICGFHLTDDLDFSFSFTSSDEKSLGTCNFDRKPLWWSTRIFFLIVSSIVHRTPNNYSGEGTRSPRTYKTVVDYHNVLILEQSSQGKAEYRRLGIGALYPEAKDYFREMQTVILV